MDEVGLRVMFDNDEDVACSSYTNNMNSIFIGRIEFNQDIESWNTFNFTNLTDMFAELLAFNQNLTGWCVTNISNWGTCTTLRRVYK